MNRRDRRAEESKKRKADYDGLKTLARTALSLKAGREASGDGVPEAACGHCGKLLDGATSGSGEKAAPGHLSICIYCAGVNIFLTDLMLGKLTEEQIRIHPNYEEIAAHQNIVRSFIRRNN